MIFKHMAIIPVILLGSLMSAVSEERVSRTMQSLSNHTRGENE